MKKRRNLLLLLVLVLVVIFALYRYLFPAGPVLADVPNPVRDRSVKNWAEEEAKVPTNPFRDVYFGDLHVHTGYSFDAYIGGIVANPEDAYIFAKGGTIDVLGKEAVIQRPLDFAAVTDHSEYFGEMYTIRTKGSPAHGAFLPRYLRSVQGDTMKQIKLFLKMLENVGRSEQSHLGFFRGYKSMMKTWDIELKAAEDYYQPGEFTTFAAYEWTYNPGLAHAHRNVFFRDMMVPDYPVSALEAPGEIALWESLDSYRAEGATVIAVPHNMNLSEGTAFPDTYPDGSAFDLNYMQTRNRNEPVAEIHQAKGNSEVNQAIWQNDEFADFENYSQGPPKEKNYIRYALKKGLEYDEKFGVNPYKYGFIGSTDTHNGTAGNTEEDDEFIGNHAVVDLDVEVRLSRQWVLDTAVRTREVVNPGGLVAVWADANTRGHIFDALARRESYATSGGRIRVRFFGGYDLNDSFDSYEAMVEEGYTKGVPMGSDLGSMEGKQASFIIWAAKDPEGANLERIQVVKGWYENGELKERIYNVALSDDRLTDEDGMAAFLDAPVDPKTGAWDHSKGAVELSTVWKDPAFNPAQRAFYYIRVLELPTPRWNRWDEIRYGVKYPDDIPKTITERAWSSPIWYRPD